MTFSTPVWQLKIDIETMTEFLCIFDRSNVLNSEIVHFMRTIISKKNAIILHIS